MLGKYCREKGNRPPGISTPAPALVPNDRLMTFVLSRVRTAREQGGYWQA